MRPSWAGALIPHIAPQLPVVLLMHYIGADGATGGPTAFYDNSPFHWPFSRSVGTNNSPVLTNAHGSPVGGETTACLFTGQGISPGAALTTPSPSPLELTNQDFVIEFSVFYSSLPTTFNNTWCMLKMLEPQATGAGGGSWGISYSGTTNNFNFFWTQAGVRNTVQFAAGAGAGFAANVWNAVCFERIGTALTCYINGIAVEAHTVGLIDTSSDQFQIGSAFYASAGYIDSLEGTMAELRITVGAHRYGGNYTPRTTPFPNPQG